MSNEVKKKYQSIFGLNCPQCRKGNLFDKKGIFVYRKMLHMPEKCDVCGLKYEIEPGFWLGALWASYPIVILVEFPFLMLAIFDDTFSHWVYFSAMVIAFFITWPFMLRVGRSAWIHICVKYKAPKI